MAHLPPLSKIPSTCFTGEIFAVLIISILGFYYVAKFEIPKCIYSNTWIINLGEICYIALEFHIVAILNQLCFELEEWYCYVGVFFFNFLI
jgi:hypothetical protein